MFHEYILHSAWWYFKRLIRGENSTCLPCILHVNLPSEEFENTNEVIRKDRQHNGKKKKDKRTNNDQQNTTQRIKDWATRTSLKAGGNLRCSGRVCSSFSTSYTFDIRGWNSIPFYKYVLWTKLYYVQN